MLPDSLESLLAGLFRSLRILEPLFEQYARGDHVYVGVGVATLLHS